MQYIVQQNYTEQYQITVQSLQLIEIGWYNEIKMQTLNPYILILQEQFYSYYDPVYVEYIAIPSCIIIPFFVGRLFHQKRLSILLDQVNNQEIARSRLSEHLTRTTSKMKVIRQKKAMAIAVTIVILMSLGFQMYQFDPAILLNLGIAASVAVLWTLAFLSIKYLTWRKQHLEFQLKNTNISTQEEVKAILLELGPEIQQGLKQKFDREIQMQHIKQQKEQCKLYKCHEQKKVLNQLHDIYKTIIGELQKFQWCDLCAQQKNVNVSELRLAQIDNNIKVCAKASTDPKISLDKRKQITNRVLSEWTKLSQKLPYICKKGCCLKFKTEVDEIKNKYHGKIKASSAKLH